MKVFDEHVTFKNTVVMKPFRQHGVAFGRDMRFDFRCSYNISTNDITAKKNIENEQFIESTKGDGNFLFNLYFYETSKFESITEQSNITIGNLMFFEIRALAPVPGLKFFVHGCVVRGSEAHQIYKIVDKGCPDHYTKTTRYGSYTQEESVRFSYTAFQFSEQEFSLQELSCAVDVCKDACPEEPVC